MVLHASRFVHIRNELKQNKGNDDPRNDNIFATFSYHALEIVNKNLKYLVSFNRFYSCLKL